nr:hypothetical protein 12 [bacterium]
MSDANSFLDLANEMIGDFGASIILRKQNTSEYDVSTGKTSQNATDYETKGVIESYSEQYIASGLVASGDRKITIAADSITVEPEQGDTIIIGSDEFSVINVGCELYADTPVIYNLQVRK